MKKKEKKRKKLLQNYSKVEWHLIVRKCLNLRGKMQVSMPPRFFKATWSQHTLQKEEYRDYVGPVSVRPFHMGYNMFHFY